MNKLFTVKGGKFTLSAHGQDLAPLFGNVTKVKILSEIKPPLAWLDFVRLSVRGRIYLKKTSSGLNQGNLTVRNNSLIDSNGIL